MPKDKYQRPKSKSQRIKPFAPKSRGPTSVKARLDVINNNNVVSNPPILKEDDVVEDDVTPTLVVDDATPTLVVDDATPPFEVDEVDEVDEVPLDDVPLYEVPLSTDPIIAQFRNMISQTNATYQRHLTGLKELATSGDNIPKQPEIAILFMNNHGKYNIDENLEYDIIKCPVNKLIRYQYSPYGTCALVSHETFLSNYVNVHNALISPTSDMADGYTSIKNETKIVQKLRLLGEELKRGEHIAKDFYKINNLKRKFLGQTMINTKENIEKSNKVFIDLLGQELINKTYEIHKETAKKEPDDTLSETSLTENKTNVVKILNGVSVLFNVTFRLPDIFFTNHKLDELKVRISSFVYPIGIYNDLTHEITYMANTELLSCPFFWLFIELQFPDSVTPDTPDTPGRGWTIVNGPPLPGDEKRPMIFRYTTEMICSYFQHIDMLVTLDYGCGSWRFNPEAKEKLKDRVLLNKTTNRLSKPLGARGGRKKTKKRTNKRRLSKRRTKRRPTKYYMKTT